MTTHERSTSPSTVTSMGQEAGADPKAVFYERLEQLKQAYYSDLQIKIEHFTNDWKRLQHQWDHVLFENMYRTMHNLAGSGATFGFAALGQFAREIANILKPTLNNGIPLSEDSCQQIEELLSQLRIAADLSPVQEHTPFLAHRCATKYELTQSAVLIIDHEFSHKEELICQPHQAAMQQTGRKQPERGRNSSNASR